MPPKKLMTETDYIDAARDSREKKTKRFESKRSEAGKTPYKKWIPKDGRWIESGSEGTTAEYYTDSEVSANIGKLNYGTRGNIHESHHPWYAAIDDILGFSEAGTDAWIEAPGEGTGKEDAFFHSLRNQPEFAQHIRKMYNTRYSPTHPMTQGAPLATWGAGPPGADKYKPWLDESGQPVLDAKGNPMYQVLGAHLEGDLPKGGTDPLFEKWKEALGFSSDPGYLD